MGEQSEKFRGVPVHLIYEQASAHFRAGNYTDALKTLLPLVAAYPENPDILHATGLCYLRLNRAKDAAPILQSMAALGDGRAKSLEAEFERSNIVQSPLSYGMLRDAAYLLGPLVLVAAAILTAAPELLMKRTLLFPESESVGSLSGVPAVPPGSVEAVSLGEARGEVEVPLGLRVTLSAVKDARLDQLPKSTTAWIRELEIESPTDSDLRAVALWPRLNKLTLNNAERLTNGGLRAIGAAGALQVLYLERAPISKEGLDALLELDDLESLTFAHCPEVNGTAIAPLAALGKLTQMDLRLPQFDDTDLESLKDFYNLETLRLEETAISDVGIQATLPALNVVELKLYRNERIGDPGLEALTRMPMLRVLEIRGGAFTAAGLARLESIDTLQVLKVLDAKVVASETPSKLVRTSLNLTSLAA